MKHLVIAFLFLLVIGSCSEEVEPKIDPSKNFSFQITGHANPVSFSQNGRSEINDEITNLFILVLDSEDQVVFQKRYMNNVWLPEENRFIRSERLLPKIEDVYRDMNGRHFMHPAMHKPPWNYVTLGR